MLAFFPSKLTNINSFRYDNCHQAQGTYRRREKLIKNALSMGRKKFASRGKKLMSTSGKF